MTKIEDLFDQILAVPVIQDYVTQLQEATTQLQEATAEAAAITGQSRAESSLVNSYVEAAGTVISVDDLGDVTINAHTRVYGDSTLNPSVSVAGSTISTGETAGAVIRVYYVDPTRAGGTVTYQFTVDPDPVVPQTGDNHSVGAVTVPVTGTEDGAYLRPPGYISVL